MTPTDARDDLVERTMTTPLSDLADRVERLTGPDREVDALIHKLVFPDDAGAAPEYTGRSIAALILFPDRSARAIAAAALRARAALNAKP